MTGRADLIRALATDRLPQMARLLGYEEVVERPRLEAPPPSIGDSPRRRPTPKAKPPPAAPAMFWRPEHYLALDPEAAERRHSEDLARLRDCVEAANPSDESADVREHPPLPEPPPLGDFAGVVSALRRVAARPAPVRAPDVPKLIRDFSRAEGLRRVPRLTRPRWGAGARLLIDRAAHLKPYDFDLERLAEDITRLFPHGGVSDDVCRSPEDALAPCAEELVIVLSDLGTLSPSPKTAMAAWRRVGLGLRASGRRAVAVLPTAPGRDMGDLRRIWSVCGWGRWWLGDDASEGELRRLEAIVAPAVRVEPGLLRGLRLLLARHPNQKGVAPGPWIEAAFWMSGYFARRHIDAAAPDPQRRKAPLKEFAKLDEPLRDAALTLIHAWRTGASWAGENEWMALDEKSLDLVSPDKLAGSAGRFQGFVTQMTSAQGGGRGEASYFRRYLERLPPEALHTSGKGEDIRSSAIRVMRTAISRGCKAVFDETEDEAMPDDAFAHYNLDLLEPSPLPERKLGVRQVRGELVLGDDPGTGSLLATIGFRHHELIREPLPPFWKSATPPHWADAWGCDGFGPWVEFSVRPKRGDPALQRMRWIPEGTFQMGSPPDEPGRWDAEGPRHAVTVPRGYWMFDTPVTQALWRAVMGGRNPSRFKSADRPVDSVSWSDAKAFIDRINALVPDLALELPSEALWEHACRAGSETELYNGSIEILGHNNAPALDPIAWYGGNSGVDFELTNGFDTEGWPEKQHPSARAGSHPVGRKAPNASGLHDMLGNVWEWCEDHWHSTYDAAPTDGSAWMDSEPAASGARRVLRGGSWCGHARDCRSAYRGWGDPDDRSDFIGFRCARVQAGAEPGGSRRIRPAERRIAASLSGGAGAKRLIVGGPEARAPLPPGAPFVIRSDCEHVTFAPVTRPPWASAMGRDRFGLWSEFQLDTPVWPPVKQRMRWIPPGRFTMGSPEDEPGRYGDEGPPHLVTIATGFWLFDTPCTQALWEGVMGENPSRFRNLDRPVETVRWDDAKAFIAKLNGRSPGLDLSLPNEAALEYACRAGTETALYNGPIEILGERNAPALDAIAWYGGNSGHDFELDEGHNTSDWSEKQYPDTKAGTRVVATRDPNAFGLHDMIGNVWEWCEDHWHGDYDGAPSDGSAWLDKTADGARRILRGGSWSARAGRCRSACRLGHDPGVRYDVIGFRCARVQA